MPCQRMSTYNELSFVSDIMPYWCHCSALFCQLSFRSYIGTRHGWTLTLFPPFSVMSSRWTWHGWWIPRLISTATNLMTSKYESIKTILWMYFFLISYFLNLFRKGQLLNFPSYIFQIFIRFFEIYFRDSMINITIVFLFGIGISIQQRTKALLYSLSVKVGTITIMSFPGTTKRPS